MNKRIQELMLQAGARQEKKGAYTYSLLEDEEIEKFAELIVRECGQFAKDIINAGEIPADHANALLMAYFGIKND